MTKTRRRATAALAAVGLAVCGISMTSCKVATGCYATKFTFDRTMYVNDGLTSVRARGWYWGTSYCHSSKTNIDVSWNRAWMWSTHFYNRRGSLTVSASTSIPGFTAYVQNAHTGNEYTPTVSFAFEVGLRNSAGATCCTTVKSVAAFRERYYNNYDSMVWYVDGAGNGFTKPAVARYEICMDGQKVVSC